MSAKSYTTGEAAEAIGITRVTLQAWIAGRKVKAPRLGLLDGHSVRFWSEKDVAHLRKIKKKIYGWAGRPRKKRKA